MAKRMLELFDAARRVSVPIISVRTADQFATVEKLKEQLAAFPLAQWDAARGLTGANDKGDAALRQKQIKGDDTVGFAEAMVQAAKLPEKSVLFAFNAGRQLHAQEPSAVAPAVQAVANLRDQFKLNFRMLVLLGADIKVPPDLEHDVVPLTDELPGPEELAVIVKEIHEASRKVTVPTGAAMERAVDAGSGLSSFAAEQVYAMSLTEKGLDMDAVWERKRTAIEQADGLSVYRGRDTFEDLRGLDSVKARLRQHVKAKTPVGVAVWIDEGADVFQNVEQDTSGVKTDQQRALLVEMEQNNWRGMIFVGVPGSGKSAVARAFGNEAGVPTIQVDFGAMESKYVGESEASLRHALDVIKSVGRGRAFFVLTCNSLKGIRPQFQRRFRRGVFFFDLPTKDEREAIWRLYLQRYEIPTQKRPDDDGWTGAEIRECCESAWDTGSTLLEAAKYIVPVSRSRATEIEQMRREAHGRFLDASAGGPYAYKAEPMAKQVRAIELAPLAPGSMAKN